MDFPEESISQAREIADKHSRRTKSKLRKAAYIYDGHFFHIAYGFDETIKRGNCGRYLHEIRKQTDCFTLAGSVLYLIARESGLNPKLWVAIDMKDIEEGENPALKVPATHTFITAQVGRQQGQDVRYIIDPFMGRWGRASIDKDRHVIKIYNKVDGKITYRHYGTLEEMSEEEYLAKVQESRGPGGGRIALATTKRVSAAENIKINITYLPQTEELKSSFGSETRQFAEDPHSRYQVTDLITRVSKDGDFDFSQGRLEFYCASAIGWDRNENPQLPLIFPAEHALNLLQIWQLIANATGRKSRISLMRSYKLEDRLTQAGFSDRFEVEKGTMAAQVVAEQGVQQLLGEVQEAVDASAGDFVSRCRSDELTYNSILRSAHYVKASDGKRSKDNPHGMIFSDEGHSLVLKQGFRDYKRLLAQLFRISIDEIEVGSGLKPGSVYHAKRRFNRGLAQLGEKVKYFHRMAAAHKSKNPLTFHLTVDKQLFRARLEAERKTLAELEQGITEQDLRRAVQARLYDNLIFANVIKDALFLASFKPGLKRLLRLS